MKVLAFAASNSRQSINRTLAAHVAGLIEGAQVISYAEHNGSYTAAYKNLFDWMSRITRGVFQDRPTLLLSTSPGPGGAANVLAAAKNSAPHFAADVRAAVSVPSFHHNFDLESNLVSDVKLRQALHEGVRLLVGTAG